jgi:monoamine oxidase
VVAEAMVERITTKPEASTIVKRIALRRNPGAETKMEVDMIGPQGAQTREYDTVFNTTTLGSARRMDLRGAELHPAQKEALRVLHYDASCKVGIKFKTPWWITLCDIAQGGGASSDLPLRTCVYPSYNLHDGPNNPAVLLASYTWAQDAQRIGTLVQRDSPAGEDDLKELILRDLARLHSAHGITYAFLCEQYITHHAYDWYADPHMSGAFALFGPGQFSHLYPYLTRPAADGKLHFVGEAASAHHAWIVGALDSAQRALLLALRKFGMEEQEEIINATWGPVTEVEWGLDGVAHLQLILGALEPQDMVEVDDEDFE